MKIVFLIAIVALLSACDNKVRVTIKVKSSDAGVTKTSTTAVP